MNKSIRKLLTGVLVCTSLVAVGATAYATTGSFYFNLTRNEVSSSSIQYKDDGEQIAYITVTNSDLSSVPNDTMHLRVRTEYGELATSAVEVKGTTGRYYPRYTLKEGIAGAGYKLYGQYDYASPYQKGMAEGRWTP